jgi:hypothetical protein
MYFRQIDGMGEQILLILLSRPKLPHLRKEMLIQAVFTRRIHDYGPENGECPDSPALDVTGAPLPQGERRPIGNRNLVSPLFAIFAGLREVFSPVRTRFSAVFRFYGRNFGYGGLS